MPPDNLRFAIIELTPECNLRCRHCYNWWDKEIKGSGRRDSYKKAFRLLDYLIKNTPVENITFTGGEPTISERFTELVLHARVKGKRVTVITNGNGSPAVYRQLADLKVNMMEFSIHASVPEIHDKITGIAGSWKKAVENMNLMLKEGISITPVIVVSSLNYHYAKETVHFFFRSGIRSIMVNRYNIGGEGLKHAGLSANAEQLKETFGQLNRFAGEHPIRIFSGVCTPHCLLNPDDYENIRFGNCSANPYQRPLTFDPDGNVRLCNHSPVIAGNIYEQLPDEIFKHNSYLRKWEDLDISFCRNCVRLEKCKGGCRAASEQAGLSLKDVDPIVGMLEITPFV